MPAQTHDRSKLLAAARALGTSGGGAGAARVMALLYNPDVEVGAVLDCVRGEPGLVARVLKVANSPYYRQAGNIGTVERAVAVLGLTAVRGVAASGCLDRMTPPSSGPAFDPERFRLHCLAVACAAQQLSGAAGAGIDGEAYMAGLLHDIGLLLLLKADAAAMASYRPPMGGDAVATRAAEQAHFGTTHEECALLLTQTWQMPDWLAGAITGPHRPAEANAERLTGLPALPTVLSLADQLAQAAGFGLQPGPAEAAAAGPADIAHGAAQGLALGLALGLSADQVLAVLTGLPETIAALQAAP
jgi:HD-like signal output (HDOD) protein